MAVLELALTVPTARKGWIKNKILFAWWAANTWGLMGSQAFLMSLDKGQLRQLACAVDADVIASSNYVLSVLNGTTAPTLAAAPGSTQIQKLFTKYLEDHSVAYVVREMDASSDASTFVHHGIPANGAQAGGSGVKTVDQRKLFGGLADTPADTCYHKSCDTVEHLSSECLGWIVKSTVHVVQALASQKELRSFLGTTAKAKRLLK
eukprot:TRINITY_DN9623_c0_g1_i1.p1 TRINITY_DN9623_c0_g1~~TRINITY_DN9623_c0_g1_i1.p1  ORF type:complete len:228 (+),score=50.27 TRINITY_DN9623_c0_g1_i1:67-684(+)